MEELTVGRVVWIDGKSDRAEDKLFIGELLPEFSVHKSRDQFVAPDDGNYLKAHRAKNDQQ